MAPSKIIEASDSVKAETVGVVNVLLVSVCVCASNTKVSPPVNKGRVTVRSAARLAAAKTY